MLKEYKTIWIVMHRRDALGFNEPMYGKYFTIFDIPLRAFNTKKMAVEFIKSESILKFSVGSKCLLEDSCIENCDDVYRRIRVERTNDDGTTLKLLDSYYMLKTNLF